jgi:hypothetical protein
VLLLAKLFICNNLSAGMRLAQIFQMGVSKAKKRCGVLSDLLPSKFSRREGTSGTTPSPVQHTAGLFYYNSVTESTVSNLP